MVSTPCLLTAGLAGSDLAAFGGRLLALFLDRDELELGGTVRRLVAAGHTPGAATSAATRYRQAALGTAAVIGSWSRTAAVR